jgi:phosphoglucosamine mutase
VEQELGDHGRVLVRPSGTEPLVRVMVEAPTQTAADTAARQLADVIAAHGSSTPTLWDGQ